MAKKSELLDQAALARPDWADRVRAAFPASLLPADGGEDEGDEDDEDEDEDREEDQARQDLEAVCEAVLAQPRAIAHPDWGGLLRAVVALSADYRALTEDVYGDALDPDEAEDDEGGAVEMIQDLGLSTIGLALSLLAHPAAVARADWAELVRHVLEEKRRRFGSGAFLSEGWEEADALFESEPARHHPEAAALQALAAEILPLEGETIGADDAG
jgi:hypothetical protein